MIKIVLSWLYMAIITIALVLAVDSLITTLIGG